MNKEFIPYEQALALKELGFDEPCLGYFDIQYNGITQSSSGRLILGKDPDTLQCTKKMLYIHGQLKILAPTYSQAFRWFREKYNLQVYIDFYHKDSYYYMIKSQVEKSISDSTGDIILQAPAVFQEAMKTRNLIVLKN
jgi:hypothetical protein